MVGSSQERKRPLPIEFTLLGISTVEPWAAADCLSMSKVSVARSIQQTWTITAQHGPNHIGLLNQVMAFELSGNVRTPQPPHLPNRSPAGGCTRLSRLRHAQEHGCVCFVQLPYELRRYSLLLRGLTQGRIRSLMPPYGAECSDGNNGTCQDRGGGEDFFPNVLQPHDCPLCAGSCCPPWTNPPPAAAAGVPGPTSRPHRPRSKAEVKLVESVRASLSNTTTNPMWRNPRAWPTEGGLLGGFGPLGQQGSWAHLVSGKDEPVPFLDFTAFSLHFHCLSLAFHCLFTAFRGWPEARRTWGRRTTGRLTAGSQLRGSRCWQTTR